MKKGIIATGMVALTDISALTGCNAVTRRFGGTTTINLPSGEKVAGNVQWDDAHNIWVLTEPMQNGDTPRTYDFKEYSNYGILSGNVVIHENK